ncbi:MAG: hypothetical protein OXF49_01475 [Candidatus Saccharibacteria bacterium]|nr:hypothetical protein [Candidatus Saccharibacteria bacterium]
MNQDLLHLIGLFATKPQSEVLQHLSKKDSNEITKMLFSLLVLYFNDSNSSTLREATIVRLCGFNLDTNKLGYNGYRQSSIAEQDWCEAKPVNIKTQSLAKNPRKLDGNANISDFTHKRLAKLESDNPTIIVGGFIDGRLFYIFSFKFKHQPLIQDLKTQLLKQLPDGDKPSIYLRSANIKFSKYLSAPDLDLQLFVNKSTLEEHQRFVSKTVYSKLLSRFDSLRS